MSATQTRNPKSSHPWNTNGSPPDRSTEQRMTALARANEVRVGIAAIKAELKAGSRDFSDTILRPPPCVESARVYDLLVQLPRMGTVKARFLLRCLDMTDATRIRHLSPQRRRKLVVAVEERVWLRPLSSMRQVARGGGL